MLSHNTVGCDPNGKDHVVARDLIPINEQDRVAIPELTPNDELDRVT